MMEDYVKDPGVFTHVAPFWQPSGVPANTWHSFTSTAHVGPCREIEPSGIQNDIWTGQMNRWMSEWLTCQLSGQRQWNASNKFKQVPAFWHGLLLHVFRCTVYELQNAIKLRLNHNWALIIWEISLEWNRWLQRYLFYCLNFCLKRRHSGVELIYLVCNIRRCATVLYGIDIIFVNFDLEQSWLKLDYIFIKTLFRFIVLK